MSLDTHKDLILEWAAAKGLTTADPMRQMVKLTEEVGELASGLCKDNKSVIYDSIGDCFVVLTILAAQVGEDISVCVRQAYEEIKNRTGVTKNGIFVKDEQC